MDKKIMVSELQQLKTAVFTLTMMMKTELAMTGTIHQSYFEQLIKLTLPENNKTSP